MMATTDEPFAIAAAWLTGFASALYNADPKAVASTLQPAGWLRDILTFSWDNRTLEGEEQIVAYLSDKLPSVKISDVRLSSNPFLQPARFPDGPVHGVEFGYTYETPFAHGQGFVRLLQDPNREWRGHIVSMIIMDLKGHEEPTARYLFEDFVGKKTWGDYTSEQRSRVESDPQVIIIGAGQIGVQVAARFKQMNIPCIIIERNNRVGDNWRNRYASLALHGVKEQHQLLYQPHPSNWPVYPPRDRVANMLETYAITQELIVWTNSRPVGRPVYDRKKSRWAITIDHDGFTVEFHPAHIVLATGTLGAPQMPTLPDLHRFPGIVLHATQYQQPTPFAGQDVVVVGAGNSSVDICQDLAEGGAKSVTMIQRSPVCVVGRDEENVKVVQAFSPDVPIEVNDFKLSSTPRSYIARMTMGKEPLVQYWDTNKAILDKVRKGGFVTRMEKPQVVLWFERMGGYWLDKGQSDLIASGEIKIKYGVEPQAFSNKGMILSDGTELPADAVIFATGYTNMREVNRQLFGPEVIDKTRQVWGMDDEGEVPGSYRPSGHPGLWYAAGDFFNARFQSKHLAIQIKAIELGLMIQA